MWPLEELQVFAPPGFGFVLQPNCSAVVFFTVCAHDISVPAELLYVFHFATQHIFRTRLPSETFWVRTTSRCDVLVSVWSGLPFFRVDVVICLSTTVRNDTLQDAKEQRVSVKCRKQLRVEEVEMVCSLTFTGHIWSHFPKSFSLGRGDKKSSVCVCLDQHIGLSAVNALMKLVLIASCLFFLFSSWT